MRKRFRRFTFLAIWVVAGGSLQAQEVPDWLSRVSIHGYVSQAWAVSDEHQIFGIPTAGTTDYRDLALQFRYDQDPKNAFALQLRQQRFGESPREVDDVELDWAFYQHRFSDRLSLKAGRIPLPLGIFNEAGGSATTSAFLRPPGEFYDRQYTSKTLEGALASVSIDGPAGWTFDADGYFGQWAVDQWGETERVDARNAYGAQIWANTPLEGVRVGAGAYRCDIEPAGGPAADYLMIHGSIDADLDRWRFAVEYLGGNLDTYGRYRSWYGQAGFQVSPRFSVHVRRTVARMHVPANGHSVDADVSDDLGVSLNYAIHPAVLFKLEGHTNEGLLRDDVPRNLYASPSETRYLIASVVASF